MGGAQHYPIIQRESSWARDAGLDLTSEGARKIHAIEWVWAKRLEDEGCTGGNSAEDFKNMYLRFSKNGFEIGAKTTVKVMCATVLSMS